MLALLSNLKFITFFLLTLKFKTSNISISQSYSFAKKFLGIDRTVTDCKTYCLPRVAPNQTKSAN